MRRSLESLVYVAARMCTSKCITVSEEEPCLQMMLYIYFVTDWPVGMTPCCVSVCPPVNTCALVVNKRSLARQKNIFPNCKDKFPLWYTKMRANRLLNTNDYRDWCLNGRKYACFIWLDLTGFEGINYPRRDLPLLGHLANGSRYAESLGTP